MNYAALFLHRVFLPSERRRRAVSLPPACVRRVFPAFLPLHLFSFAPVIFRLRMPKAARKEKTKKQILVHVSSKFGRSSDTEDSYQNHITVLYIVQGSVAKCYHFSCHDSEKGNYFSQHQCRSGMQFKTNSNTRLHSITLMPGRMKTALKVTDFLLLLKMMLRSNC